MNKSILWRKSNKKIFDSIAFIIFAIINSNLYALETYDDCIRLLTKTRADCAACNKKCLNDFNESVSNCKSLFNIIPNSGLTSTEIDKICRFDAFLDSSGDGFAQCNANCKANQCKSVTCYGITAPIFDEEESIDDIIDFEILGPEGEEEFIDLEIEIDGINVTNFNQLTILDNIIRVEQLVQGSHIITIQADGYGVRSLAVNVAGASGAQQEIPFLLRYGAPVSGVVQWYNDFYNPIEGAQVLLVSISDSTVDYATTDAYGEFEFAGVSAGTYRLISFAEGFAMKELGQITTDGETAIDDIEFTYPSNGYAGTLSGTVTYENEPIEGVNVRVALADLTGSRALVPIDLENYVPFIEVVTDENGEFEITNAPREMIKLAAFKHAYASDVVGFDLKNNSSFTNIEIELDVFATMYGEVQDDNEDPVAGIEVTAIPDFEIPDSDVLVLGLPRTAVTNGSGAFGIAGLPAGEYKLYATPEDSHDTTPFSRPPVDTAEAGDDDVLITLGGTSGSIIGTIACDYGSGAEVCYEDTFQIGLSEDSLITISGTDGEFELTKLLPGSYDVFIRGETFPSIMQAEVEVVANEDTDLGTIVVRDTNMSSIGSVVEGAIVKENLDPVEGAVVSLGKHFTGGGIFLDSRWPIRTTTTDSLGQYSFGGVDADDIGENSDMYVIADYPGFRSAPLPLEDRTVYLLLEATGSLEGSFDCDSTPIPAIVQAEALPSRALSLFVSTEADGSYRFDSLAPGDYRVSVIPTKSICGMPTGVEVAAAEVTILSGDTEEYSDEIYNDPPIADAGEYQIVYNDDPVALDGTESIDADIISYEWFLLNLSTGSFDFVDEGDTIEVDAPTLDEFALYLLVVTDGSGAQSQDTTFIAHIEEP